MDLRYNVVEMEAPYTRETRQHDHHHHVPPDTSSGSTGSADNSTSSSAMAMFFHVGEVETILFEFWQTESALALFASCLVVFIVAVLYELLKFYRELLKRKERNRLEGGAQRRRSRRSRRHRREEESADEYSLPMSQTSAVPGTGRSGITVRIPWLAPMHLYQTLLHMLQVTISFMLMLVFMTFNVWLCLACVIGSGLGYFLFFVRDVSISEHCN